MQCRKCKNDTFKIEIIDLCSDCEHNGAYDGEEWIYDQDIIDQKNLTRDEAQEGGQCQFGSNWNAGCYMFICAKCGGKINLAVMED